MQIKKIDVLWNYTATFLKIAASAILLPVILRALPAQDVGVWSIFSSISALIFLLDFGFNSSFARNVTYIFSGVQSLKKEGFNTTPLKSEVNYSLLNATIKTMRWFYSRVSILLLLILLTGGSYYIHVILKGYVGDKTEVVTAWILFCLINTYNLYTLYYDALLEGRGLVKISKQIIILGNIIYLIVGTALVWGGFGLVALVLAQLISVVVIRILSYRTFFTNEIKKNLSTSDKVSKDYILQAVYPNAVKYGLTSLGGFMIQKSSVFIGSIFLALTAIASFGLTKQLIDIIIAVANITLATYLPQITNLRVEGNLKRIKDIYIKGILVSNFIFISGALFVNFFGQCILEFLNSNTKLVSSDIILAMTFSALIGLNAGISGAVISTRNEIPFVKPSIFSGLATIVVLLVIFNFTNWGLFGMALAPGIIDLCYQGWKWPLVVYQELKITGKDIKEVIVGIVLQLFKKSRI